MGMTLTEKILAKASGNDVVTPGQMIMAKLRTVATMDTQGKMVLENFSKLGIEKLPNPDMFVLVFDHRVPTDDVKQAELHKKLRAMVKQYGVKNFYDVGRGGILHQILPEHAHVFPGTVCVATESHTPTGGAVGAVVCGVGQTEAAMALATGDIWLSVPKSIKVELTGRLPKYVMSKDVALYLMGLLGYEKEAVYKAVEFAGPGVATLSMDARLTMANMVSDVGAKNAIFPVDDVTVEYFKKRTNEKVDLLEADPDANYDRVIRINLDEMVPQIAVHPSMDNIQSIDVVEAQHIKVDQAVVGTCTNGRIEDMRITAEILNGKKIAPHVRFILTPASQEVMAQMAEEGLIEILVRAGVEFSAVSCGCCAGVHHGLLADDEVAISASPRNWVGRMGSKKGKIYVSSPAVVAASAIEGYICDPRK